MQKKILSPARLILLLTAAIFLAEFLLMLLLRYWSTLTEPARAFVDAFVLIVVLSPALYFLFYRSIKKEIEARFTAEKELRNRNRELDLFVVEETPGGGATFCLELNED